jgi:hypothetical protein
MSEGAQGIGNYLMDAAQTMGDNLTKIFDRIGELTVGAVGAVTGAFGGASTTTAVAAAAVSSSAGTSAAVSAPSQNAPSAPEAGMGMGQAVTSIITLPAAAFAALQTEKDNPISLAWASPDRGDVLSKLASPNTPSMGVDRSTGMVMA